MKRHWRLLLYGFVGAAVLIAAFVAPAAWATPGQSDLAQTVPTRTPTARPVVATQVPPPTEEPAPTPVAGATVLPSPTLAAPAGTAGGSSTLCASSSSFTLTSDRSAVWPGATVVFTATLTNTSRAPMRQIVLEDQLANGLEPAAVISGGGAWQARKFTASSQALSPGARFVAVYSARVASTLPAQAIVARASATTAGCPRKTASVTLGLPPAQLPATGGSLD